MKKQMIALAVAGAFVGSAYAANVNVYGVVDTGLVYSKTEFGGEGVGPDAHSFTMDNGVLAGSRFGFKGTEDLGDGYSVEFKLENGFDSDTGALHTSGKIFDREARLSLNTPYGTISFGRMGALTSGAGTYDIFQATGDSLDGGNANYIGTGYWFSRARYDNMLTYVTPEANGFTGYAQYSFKTDGSENAQVRRNDRYAALGLTYSAGPLNVAVVADMVMHATDAQNGTDWIESVNKEFSDAKAISFGANYDFGVTKAFFGAQYGKNEKLVSSSNFTDEDVAWLKEEFEIPADYEKETIASEFSNLLRFDGYNLHIGAVTPLPCGTLSVSAYYGDYEHSKTSAITAKKYGIGAMHTYQLSKRTTFYTGVGYGQVDVEVKEDGEKDVVRAKGYDVTIGLNHTF